MSNSVDLESTWHDLFGRGVGGVARINLVPETLRAYYGTQTPVGFVLFVRFRPAT
ncbi:MAG TPA: hypothetical protein VK733_00340 [Gemmatimonadaceae bacterium]|nr:hypothetical protein [Gemmatimonadaceae bacterium]